MASRTPGTFDVNVKDFRGGSVVVSVQPTWNVAQVKQEISRKMGVAAPEFKLVFAGQTLSDDITLAVSMRRLAMVLDAQQEGLVEGAWYK